MNVPDGQDNPLFSFPLTLDLLYLIDPSVVSSASGRTEYYLHTVIAQARTTGEYWGTFVRPVPLSPKPSSSTSPGSGVPQSEAGSSYVLFNHTGVTRVKDSEALEQFQYRVDPTLNSQELLQGGGSKGVWCTRMLVYINVHDATRTELMDRMFDQAELNATDSV
jgi:hypothetical protein